MIGKLFLVMKVGSQVVLFMSSDLVVDVCASSTF